MLRAHSIGKDGWDSLHVMNHRRKQPALHKESLNPKARPGAAAAAALRRLKIQEKVLKGGEGTESALQSYAHPDAAAAAGVPARESKQQVRGEAKANRALCETMPTRARRPRRRARAAVRPREALQPRQRRRLRPLVCAQLRGGEAPPSALLTVAPLDIQMKGQERGRPRGWTPTSSDKFEREALWSCLSDTRAAKTKYA